MTTDPISPLEPSGLGPASQAPRGAVLCGIVALSGFILYQGPSLWDEVSALRRDLSQSQRNAIIGYVGISPNPSAAAPPGEWFRVEGNQVRLWAGWHPERGHRWFLARPDDLDRGAISESIGRDLFQGIDRPVAEVGGGPISDRIPDEHEVDAIELDGVACAYPVLVLDKVLLVNDEVDRRPLLVLYARRGEGGSSAFEPVLDGERLVMGFAGYIYKGRPLLYDRTTEGLWVEQDEGLVSLSGPNRGRLLRRLGRLERVRWDAWSDRHEGGRVLVGADRSIAAATL